MSSHSSVLSVWLAEELGLGGIGGAFEAAATDPVAVSLASMGLARPALEPGLLGSRGTVTWEEMNE